MENSLYQTGKPKHDARADVGRFTGIFETLMKEHREAVELLERVARSGDPKERERLWPRLRNALLAHEHTEVDVLYPLLRKHVETREIAQRHDAEARDLEMLIERLDNRAFDHDEWQASAATLLQLLDHHVREEETEFFPRAKALLGPERVAELNDAYRKQKAEWSARSTRGQDSFRVVV
ncbi:MAG: hemerythrin domain-containing protein [Polyangiaceae bacterium]